MSATDRRRACQADFLWFTIFFGVSSLLLWIAVDLGLPRATDTEYGTRLALLRARLAEHPDRPLLLLIGSSRIGLGVHPEVMPELRAADGRIVLPFNQAHMAAGPMFSRVQLERLLRAGIRPSWVVAEVAPTILAGESLSNLTTDSTFQDLPVIADYVPAYKYLPVFLRGRLNPWFKHRQILLEEFAPALASPRLQADDMRLDPLGGDDYWMSPKSLPPEEIRRRTAITLGNDAPRLRDWRPDPVLDRAVRDLLGLCRRAGIVVALLATPESSAYRALYGAAAEQRVVEYLAALGREWNVPVADARTWATDAAFSDGHHMVRAGGLAFSRKLAADFLQPLVAGRDPGRTLTVASPAVPGSPSPRR